MIAKPTVAHIVEAIVAVFIACVLFWQYQEGRSTSEALKTTIASQQVLLSQAQAQTKQFENAIASRDSAAQNQIAALQSQIQKLQTPAEIVPWLASTLNKSVPTPITVNIPTPGKDGSATAPVTATIPQEDLSHLRDLIGHCQENQVALNVCRADKIDMRSEITAKDAQIKAVTKERDAAITASKGGSFLRRTGRILKYVGIGIGIGATLAHFGI